MASNKPDAGEPEATTGNGPEADTDAMSPWASAATSPMLEFDYNQLRLPQDFEESFGARPVLTGIDVRKPKSAEWVRVHPSPDFQRLLGLVYVPAGVYVAHQNLAPLLGSVVKPRLLVAAITNY